MLVKKRQMYFFVITLILSMFLVSLVSAEPQYRENDIVIVWVNNEAEFADLENRGQEAQNMSNWELISEHGNQRCDLGGVIQAGQKMRVFAQSGHAQGMAVFNCGFNTPIWNNSELDPAVLCNVDAMEVSRYPIGSHNPSWPDSGCGQGVNPPAPPSNPPSDGNACPSTGAWPPGCVPGGSNPPVPPSNPPSDGNACPSTGAWPPGCVPGGSNPPVPPSNPPSDGNACPSTGAWPPGCVPGGSNPPVPEPNPGEANIHIVWVDKQAEYTDLQNMGSVEVDMTGWKLISERGNQSCELAFTIQPGQNNRVRIFAQQGWEQDMQGFNCNFNGPIWSNSKDDDALLMNPQGEIVFRYDS